MNKEKEVRFPQSDPLSFLWLVIGTVLMCFVEGSWPVSLAGWLAPLFFIRFMRAQKVLRGIVFTVIGLSISFTVGWWVENPLPLPAAIFGLIVGFGTTLLFLVDRLLVPRMNGRDGQSLFISTLIFPSLLTSFEFLFFNNNAMGSYASWAYTQHADLVLTQLVSITGLWGLTFLLTWFASVVNWVWERSLSWPAIRGGIAVYGGILLLVLAYGSIRLTISFPDAGTVRVHGITEIEEAGIMALEADLARLQTEPEAVREKMAGINEKYLAATVREARAGAQIVVWPEATVLGTQKDIDTLVVQAGELALQERIYLLISAAVIYPEEDRGEIRAFLLDPEGRVAIDHLKYAYGASPPSKVTLQTVDTPYGRLSVVLCGDLDVPGPVSQAGSKGVDILLVPGNESSASQGYWHVRYASFRAVEGGFSLVRQATGGVSVVMDPYGRTLAATNHHTANERLMVAQVPIHRISTLYAVFGDWFGWTSLAIFVGLAAWAIARRQSPGR